MSSKSRIRFARLANVFPYEPKNPDRNKLNAQIARLCVLYEDLRFELRAILSDHGPGEKDEFRKEWIQAYYFRRSIATLTEFSDAIVGLANESEVSHVIDGFGSKEKKAWDAAVRHFKKTKSRLKTVRNDIGGHFGLKAALCAVERFDMAEHGRLGEVEPSIGRIEWHQGASTKSLSGDGSSVPLRLHFASHIAFAAILRDAPTTGYIEAIDELISELWVESFTHAYNVMMVLQKRVWHRFGR